MTLSPDRALTPPDDDPTPAELRDFACHTARDAGRILMDSLPLGRWRGDGVEHKGGRELVSRIDRASEGFIIGQINDRYPGHAILAEESGDSTAGADRPAATHRWIIDPLDGTANYLHGHPMFAVSIAVEQLGAAARRYGRSAGVVAGAIYAPYLDELFFAAAGEGACLNSPAVRLSTSSTKTLDDALAASGFAYDRQRWPNYDNFLRLTRRCRGIRRCGSAALDLAYVAAGRYDLFWELGLQPWDMAAGALLIIEAGGIVADFAGGSGWLRGRNIVASNVHLQEAVRELLDPLPPEP